MSKLQELVKFSPSAIFNSLIISQPGVLNSQPCVKEAWRAIAVYSGEIYVYGVPVVTVMVELPLSYLSCNIIVVKVSILYL